MLEAQGSLYRRLRRASARQRSLITGEDATLLAAVLADRNKLTDDLTRVGTQLAELRRVTGDRLRMALSTVQRQRADDLLNEARQLLKTILDFDEEDVRLLATRKAQVAGAMQGLPTGRAALSAYGGRGGLGGASSVATSDRMDEEG